METIHTIEWMKQTVETSRANARIVGFVPTMGALHEGHFSLIREAQIQCSPVVVSIFVNPKQFGPSEDFQKYPRTFEPDSAALEKLGVNYLFAPDPDKIYPKDFRTAVIVEGLGERLEGAMRPSHFRGVTTIVLKLFEIVQPHLAFFGRKDAQQARIIRQMASDLNLSTSVIVCPIVREADGLALSSRNRYLSEGDRQAATALYRSLKAASRQIESGEHSPAAILTVVRGVIKAEPRVNLDYAEIVDAETLEPAANLARPCYALVAARVGSTRLIDNALIEAGPQGVQVSI